MEREIDLKKGGQKKEDDNNRPRFIVPPANSTKPVEIERKSECEKKHITRDGKKKSN